MIAIHERPGSFSDQWIDYCNRFETPYKLVDCYSSNIVGELVDSDALMWHWSHTDPKAAQFARQLTAALELQGKLVFPSHANCWHFDDKVGQKYVMEALGFPHAQTWIFYDQDTAIEWAQATTYPKVFKLRGGAGSENVRLVTSVAEAEGLIRQAFGKGFKVKSRRYLLNERIWQLRRDRNLKTAMGLAKGLGRLFIPTGTEQDFPAQRHYAYFQEFVGGNDHDLRVIVIGDKAFALRRMVRANDFRASGSGKLDYDPGSIPTNCIQAAFDYLRCLNADCLALDFVFDEGKPLLIEFSYSFPWREFPGYWDRRLHWIEGRIVPQEAMVDAVVARLAATLSRPPA